MGNGLYIFKIIKPGRPLDGVKHSKNGINNPCIVTAIKSPQLYLSIVKQFMRQRMELLAEQVDRLTEEQRFLTRLLEERPRLGDHSTSKEAS